VFYWHWCEVRSDTLDGPTTPPHPIQISSRVLHVLNPFPVFDGVSQSDCCGFEPSVLTESCYQSVAKPRLGLFHEGRKRFLDVSGKHGICSFDK
jgi:hypothetical protein